jgi:AcrR family transcriptional regulator
MMEMSIPYESTGRTRQKARTRAAMIAATRTLLGAGITPTVEQAAEHAGVSRTTAYRYFANQRSLLVAAYPDLSTSSLLSEDAPEGVEERLEFVMETIGAWLLESETELRTMLRLSLERGRRADLPLRTGRALAWIEDALAPLRDRMPDDDRHRLALAIRATLGIEPFVWLTDVGGLAREDAVELMRTSARTLLHAALQGPDRGDP